MVLSLVNLAMGFALLPKELATAYLKQGLWHAMNDGRSMNIQFALTWFPRAEMPGYFKDLIQAIK
jgi:hypothetical protein